MAHFRRIACRSYRVLLSATLGILATSASGQVTGVGNAVSPRAAVAVPVERVRAVGPSSPALAEKQLNEQVDSLLKKMTLEEKIGQLTQYSAGTPTGPGTGRDDYAEMVSKGQVGSLLNVVGAEKTNHFQHLAMEKSRLHIPLLFGEDVIHGNRTIFPVPLGLAASFDPEMVEETAKTAAAEARADGIQWVFSPMVDIARDARWGRIVESAGEDPYLGSAMARAFVKGYQGKDLKNPESVAACVKHFAAYGAPIAGRDYYAVDMSELRLRQIYLPTYHAAIEAGAATVMSSFNSLNGVPATENPFLLTQILRHEWGFNGMVVSDWNAVGELMNHAVVSNGAESASKALTAGVDMDMESDLYRSRLMAQVQRGVVPESAVDEAVRRVLRVKFALGLFEHPYATQGPAYQPTPERRAQARKAAEESFVLLKNDPLRGTGHVLPVKGPKTIALIGPFADSQSEMLGSWVANGSPGDVVTLKTALEARLAETKGKLLYAKGTEILSDSTAGFEEAVNAAKNADVVVITLGESGSWMTGEAASRAHLDLPGNQQQLLEAVAATGKPLALLIFNGHPLALPWAAEHVPAIVEAWYPGIEAGPALANVLFGATNPSGKLPVDLPRSVGQEPLFYSQYPSGRPAGVLDLTHPPTNNAEKFLSRYIDESNSAQWPFGWGLSYTQFSYSAPTVSTNQVSAASATRGTALVKVGVDVKNTGAVAGSEVVQLYIRTVVASVEQPLRELKGFERVTLAPGEQKHMEFPLGFEELSFYNAELHQVMEPTKVQVWIGGNSDATQAADFEVTK
jgi:beta-glucosidase